jgi:hypothetical protein
MSIRQRSEGIHIKGSGTGATVAVLASFTPSNAQQFVSVIRMIVTVSAAGLLTLQDTTGAALSQPFNLGANGTITLDVPTTFDPWFTTKDSNNAGAGLQFAQGTGANTVSWDIWYLPST